MVFAGRRRVGCTGRRLAARGDAGSQAMMAEEEEEEEEGASDEVDQ